MATYLYRLGRLAFRRRRLFLLLWLALLGAAGFASSTAPPLPGESGSMPGIESQAALDLMQQRFPGNAGSIDNATARVVFVAPAGRQVTDPGNRAAIEALVGRVSRGPQVAAALSPFQAQTVSPDRSTAFASVAYKVKPDDIDDTTRNQLRTAVDAARASGLTVEVGGPVLAEKPSIGGVSELVGVALAALVLLVTFGSLVAAGLPLLTALLGVGISTLAVFATGAALGLSQTSGTLASMLGLAVGIDYALLVVSRYREERAKGHPAQEAAGLAVGTAGSAVVFAGLTVIIALAGLALIGIPAAARMGLTAAAAIAVAVLIALTLVPALLGFWPNVVLARRARKDGPTPPPEGTADNAGTRWARFVLRRPVLVLAGSIALLVVLALPVTQLQLGMPGDEAKSTATTERRAYDALARAFGPGVNGPLAIVVDARGAADRQGAAKTIAAAVGRTPGVAAVSPPQFNPAGDTALFTAVPATAPTSEATEDLVHRIRGERAATEAGTGASFLVSGLTAVNIDVASKVPGGLVRYLAVVLGLAFLLLLMIFRSLIVPLKAVFGFLLSVLAALGAVIAVFQWGWAADLVGLQQTGPIISLMPIVLVGMIFGLAMDYEVFLVSRMREAYTGGESAARSVVTGFRHSARVVVAAALIMIAVFSGFVGADLAMIKMIGFSLAAAVLFDAFVVRMALVPALLALLGERAWALPRWLDRLLPHVDLEGAALRRRYTAETPAVRPVPAEAERDPAGAGKPDA
ncbi:MMPL family transporter [Amycolatopsis solani]|uniref:MMPL family transporter n=1 Tax=Amycolatopsis solani TaxID=3028615 RepID=UPI0025B0241A|nr:MMPL family transporter [Amycolatopsis sp. MEP2-6]